MRGDRERKTEIACTPSATSVRKTDTRRVRGGSQRGEIPTLFISLAAGKEKLENKGEGE
jgi:hypothetical protein